MPTGTFKFTGSIKDNGGLDPVMVVFDHLFEKKRCMYVWTVWGSGVEDWKIRRGFCWKKYGIS